MAGVVLAVSLLWVARAKAKARVQKSKELQAAEAETVEAPLTELPVEERYELGVALGEGGFGRVVLARSRQDGRECALKIVDEAKMDAREVRVQCGLSHPHIAAMLDTFRHDGRLYIASEICHGGELVEALEDHGRYSEAEARIAFGQVMSAVAHLHSRGVAHRDLKHESFLLEERGVALGENRLKLIDFGLATTFVPGRAAMKTICGSRGFMAPEVLSGVAYDERCDVFSCGVILHGLLCDEMPFPERSSSKSPGGLPRPPIGPISFGGLEVKQSLSPEARGVIAQMLEKEPFCRPSAPEVPGMAWLLPGQAQ